MHDAQVHDAPPSAGFDTSTLPWQTRRPPRLIGQLKTQLLSWGTVRSTVVLTSVAVAASVVLAFVGHFLAGEPPERLWLTEAFGVTIPLLIGPPLLWLITHLLFDAERARRMAEQLAITDPLTRAYNRRYFFHACEVALKSLTSQGQPLSVLVMDIDHFKRINDKFGHSQGDVALRQVAQACLRSLRQDEIFARFGGEEFAVLLPNASNAAALVVAERVRAAVAELRLQAQGGEWIEPTVSVGVATLDPTGDDADTLVTRADLAMYQAKLAGRNRVANEASPKN
ncbi:MAG TPA: GGDEF domain-containing protein [Burkholderiaceae bacterium]|nr:GGDEF domain-containing protein [Burkholderiaceae bacterium]